MEACLGFASAQGQGMGGDVHGEGRTGSVSRFTVHRMILRISPFVSFNKLSRLPGNENVPPPSDMVEATRMGLYRAKCLPEVLDIIARARRMRKNHPLLRVLYILSDGEDDWAEEVRMWLQSEGWDRVWIGKRDVYPGWKDRELGVAVDMEIARRAGVFVGNGVSMRLAHWMRADVAVFDDIEQHCASSPEGRDTSRSDAVLVMILAFQTSLGI